MNLSPLYVGLVAAGTTLLFYLTGHPLPVPWGGMIIGLACALSWIIGYNEHD